MGTLLAWAATPWLLLLLYWGFGAWLAPRGIERARPDAEIQGHHQEADSQHAQYSGLLPELNSSECATWARD
jgi:hypothetical protein